MDRSINDSCDESWALSSVWTRFQYLVQHFVFKSFKISRSRLFRIIIQSLRHISCNMYTPSYNTHLHIIYSFFYEKWIDDLSVHTWPTCPQTWVTAHLEYNADTFEIDRVFTQRFNFNIWLHISHDINSHHDMSLRMLRNYSRNYFFRKY